MSTILPSTTLTSFFTWLARFFSKKNDTKKPTDPSNKEETKVYLPIHLM